MKRVLITGGAGYIGSHVAREFSRAGYLPVIFDDLSKGHREATGAFPLVVGDVRDTELLVRAMEDYSVEGVVHLAASSLVAESMQDPVPYFHNNVVGSLSVIEAVVRRRVRYIVFSSTAAVYGLPDEIPISEDAPIRPINPYGESKAMVERLLASCSRNAFFYCSLRYFNVAGAHPDGDLGEDHDPETHLIPIVLAAAAGRREAVEVYGGDYDTPDGTAVRDYIHVCDVARAHLLAYEYIKAGRNLVANLGNQRGYSVREVVEAARRVTGREIPVRLSPRREGDPPVLVADSALARRELGWRPVMSDLETIIETAWRWHLARPEGYRRAPGP